MDRNDQQAAADAPPDGSSAASQPADVTMIALAPASRPSVRQEESPAGDSLARESSETGTPSPGTAPPSATVQPSAMQEAHEVIDAIARTETDRTAADTVAKPADRPQAPRVAFRFAKPTDLLTKLRAFALPPRYARNAAYGAAAIAALAAGWAGAGLIAPGGDPLIATPAETASIQTAARLDQLSADVKALRDSVAALSKAARPRGGDELKPLRDKVSELSESINRLRADQTAKIATLADNAERSGRDASARLAQIADRLDRMDRGAPQTTGSISAPASPVTLEPPAASIPTPPPRPAAEAAKPAETAKPAEAAKPAQAADKKPLAGWALRDIYDGLALIENRRQGLIEVAPGQVVQGLGRIERIEKRSGRWVVVT
ncbi:MAG: hypothetical protein BGP06_11330, partial [Rhizobiales bacterium 65-9]